MGRERTEGGVTQAAGNNPRCHLTVRTPCREGPLGRQVTLATGWVGAACDFLSNQPHLPDWISLLIIYIDGLFGPTPGSLTPCGCGVGNWCRLRHTHAPQRGRSRDRAAWRVTGRQGRILVTRYLAVCI